MTTDADTVAANKAVVADFLATFSRGDVPGVLERMADGATWWVSGTIAGMSGSYEKRTFGALLEGVKTVYKTGAMQFRSKSMIAEGPFVAVEADSYAELTNGRIYCNQYHLLFEIRGGKVLRVKEYMDTQHAHAIFFGA
jgi:ketosteroid isomerase-like protein